MRTFTKTLKVEQLDGDLFRLLEGLPFGEFEVPAGFETDFASIKGFHNIVLYPIYALFKGYGNYGSTVHDYLYRKKIVSRKEADAIFYEALRAEGVARWRAWLMWAGVRIGASKAYGG